jgi:hypothetical protein
MLFPLVLRSSQTTPDGGLMSGAVSWSFTTARKATNAIGLPSDAASNASPNPSESLLTVIAQVLLQPAKKTHFFSV